MLSIYKTAIILLMIAFALWIYENEFEKDLFVPYIDTVFGIAGGLLLAFAIVGTVVSSLVGKTEKWQRKRRCIRCGVKIPKNELYCPAHKIEAADEFLRGKSPENN